MILLTVNEAAKRIGVSGSMVRRMLREEKLSGYKMGSGYWVVYFDDKLKRLQKIKNPWLGTGV